MLYYRTSVWQSSGFRNLLARAHLFVKAQNEKKNVNYALHKSTLLLLGLLLEHWWNKSHLYRVSWRRVKDSRGVSLGDAMLQYPLIIARFQRLNWQNEEAIIQDQRHVGRQTNHFWQATDKTFLVNHSRFQISSIYSYIASIVKRQMYVSATFLRIDELILHEHGLILQNDLSYSDQLFCSMQGQTLLAIVRMHYSNNCILCNELICVRRQGLSNENTWRCTCT